MIDLHDEAGRRWATAALTGAALLSAAYWGEATLLKFRQGMPDASPSASASAGPSVSAAVTPPADTLAQLLGAPAAVLAVPLGPAERFKVMGVIASASGQGAALIAVDGQPARAYRVGAELAPGFVLASVSQKELTLTASPGGEVLATLPLPEPGSRPGLTSNSTPGNAASAGNPSRPAGLEASGPPAVNGSRGNPRTSEPAVPAAPSTPASAPSAPTAPSAAGRP